MNEEEDVKKQLIKNMIFNLIAFSIIFYLFGTVIYSQFNKSLYRSADSELEKVISQNNSKLDMKNLKDKSTDFEEKNGEIPASENNTQKKDYRKNESDGEDIQKVILPKKIQPVVITMKYLLILNLIKICLIKYMKFL
jgi:hypothetical protein